MDKHKPTASQEVLSEAQMKAIAAVVKGFLEEALKDHIGMLQLEKGCRSTVPLISDKCAGTQTNSDIIQCLVLKVP